MSDEVNEPKKRNRNKFHPDEDARLRTLVEKYGCDAWGRIAPEMPGRTVRQCRDRWKHYLSSTPAHSEWTFAEDRLLFEKIHMIGPKWTQLCHFFPGKTDLQIKHRWTQNLARFSPVFGQGLRQLPKPRRYKVKQAQKQRPMKPASPPPPAEAEPFLMLSGESSGSAFGSRSFPDLCQAEE
jgi:hypothetical protein